MKIIDAHVHVFDPEEGMNPLHAIADALGYDHFNVASLQCGTNLLQNLICALYKVKHPQRTFAFGGLDYITGRDYLTQVKNLYAMGFDGVKMLEGKPTVRKKINIALDDPSYDPYYAFLEEKQFPLLFHVADPADFWDSEKVPEWAKANGWFYSLEDGYIPYEQFYQEVDRLLNKHPHLRAIFAHLYFLSDNPVRLQQFLDAHPQISIDITAGIEMYQNFSKDPGFWKAFFIKNSDRIIFGTDSTDRLPKSGNGVRLDGYNAMEIKFLQTDGEIQQYDMRLHGFSLPQEVLKKIMAENFIRLVGEMPKSMNLPAVLQETEYLRAYIKEEAEVKKAERLVTLIREVSAIPQ